MNLEYENENLPLIEQFRIMYNRIIDFGVAMKIINEEYKDGNDILDEDN